MDIIGFVEGVITTLVAIYIYLRGRISPEEARNIYNKAKEAIDTYKEAKKDETITTEEKLQIAEKSIEVIEEIIKDLG